MASISNAEWTVMRVLWAGAPMTAQQVIDALPPEVDWKAKTVKTLLGRLVKKGALTFERRGRVHVYSPAVSERECVSEQAHSFLDRMFGGALAPLVAHLAEEGSLEADDLDELRRVLRDAEGKETR